MEKVESIELFCPTQPNDVKWDVVDIDDYPNIGIRYIKNGKTFESVTCCDMTCFFIFLKKLVSIDKSCTVFSLCSGFEIISELQENKFTKISLPSQNIEAYLEIDKLIAMIIEVINDFIEQLEDRESNWIMDESMIEDKKKFIGNFREIKKIVHNWKETGMDITQKETLEVITVGNKNIFCLFNRKSF